MESKGLEALEKIKDYKEWTTVADITGYKKEKVKLAYNNELNASFTIIEKELKQAEEDRKVLDIFKNALTIEYHDYPMADHSKDAISYFFRTVTTIKQNELDKDLRKNLREWVLKNAFPKELKALKIIKESINISVEDFFYDNVTDKYYFIGNEISKEQYDLLKEVLV